MFITYINRDGNKEIQDFLEVPKNFTKIDGIYFEPREENIAEQKEQPKQVINNDYIEEKAREFLRENKVKGFGLLKGSKIVDKAIANGFII
jgi:hypothetical protein